MSMHDANGREIEPHGPPRVRYEDFGAIIALSDPPALVHIDHTMVAELNLAPSPYRDAPLGHLSAPTEVHVLATERCPAGCSHCYVDATREGAHPSTAELRALLESLAEFGVFHVALGGGESMLRDDLFELAHYARALGLVPNLTTSGIGMTLARAAQCTVFGQVNVSLDGLDDVYEHTRGYDGSGKALSGLRMLSAAGVATGINVVLTRGVFDTLAATVEAAVDAGAQEVELLRFKPTGRAKASYFGVRLCESRGRRLMPLVTELARKYASVNMKIDCSLVPFLCATDPDPELLRTFGVIGCEAGNVLAAVRADLNATACSFVESSLGDARTLISSWTDNEELQAWRGWAARAPEPCRSCAYRDICKGGCKVVSLAVNGETFTPDPECPRVLAHARGETFVPITADEAHE